MIPVWQIRLSMTIVWHVDDLKLSHKDPKVVDEMIKYLKGLYEKLPNGEVKEMES